MKILSIDASCERLLITCAGAYKTYHGGRATPYILPLVNELLTELNLELADLDGFSAVVGPGSFTGVRVGVSTINAFCLSTGKKAVAVTSLELAGENAYLPAGNDNYYIKTGERYYFDSTAPANHTQFSPEYPPQMLEQVAQEKFSKGQETSILTPFYMRKSQAERMADGD